MRRHSCPSYSQRDAFPLSSFFSSTSALFCACETSSLFTINHFRTLYEKQPGWGGTYEQFVGILTAASCGALRGGRLPAGGELHQAKDGVAEDQERQSPGGVFTVGGNRGDEKQNGSGEGDAGGPGIAPRAVGAVHLRFALTQDKKRSVRERVIRDEEKRKHGNDALEGAEDKSDSRDGAEQQGNRRRAALVYFGGLAKEQAVRAHGIERARTEKLIGVEAAQHGNDHDGTDDGIAESAENTVR